jgi:hypothetical protein
MKIKTSELTRAALNWAVAKCEEWPMGIWYDEDELPMMRDDEVMEWKPSSDWAQGGPIIERMGIGIWKHWSSEDGSPLVIWYAEERDGEHEQSGDTPLNAAMRCYVASKLGDEVEIPDELSEMAA